MPNDDDKDFNDIFEIETLPVQAIEVYDAPTDAADSYDLEAARQNIHHLLQKGTVALDELISLARQSQSVAAFEQVSKMLKNLSDINKDLITVQEKKKIMKIQDDVKTKEGTTQVTNNNLFVGTTEELDKIIDLQRNK